MDTYRGSDELGVKVQVTPRSSDNIIQKNIQLSSQRRLQEAMLERIKNTKNTKIIRLENTKSELQGVENTTCCFCIFFAIWVFLPKVNMGFAFFLPTLSLYFSEFCILEMLGLYFFVFCIFEILGLYFFVFCIFEILDSYFFRILFVFFVFL